MRFYLLIVLFGLQINCIVSQISVYHHFPTSNAVWRVDHISNQCGQGNMARSYQYTIGADTTIGNFFYKKVYASGMQFCEIATYFDDLYIGGIRYDSVNKKVYFNFPGYSDTILYNFIKLLYKNMIFM